MVVKAIEKGPTGRIKKIRELVSGMTRDDVLEVLESFSAEHAAIHGFAESTDYDLIHEGRSYPPKAVFGLSAAREVGRVLEADEFSGDVSSPCFARLRSLGFTIQRKERRTSDEPIRHPRLERLATYGRKEIAEIFEPEHEFTPGAGRWGMPGIVETPANSGNFVFMVTLGPPAEGNPYQDALTLDGHLIWESQTQQGFGSPAIKKLLVHDESANNIHLFLRAKKTDRYIYLGLLKYSSHDPNKENPVHFVWTVLNWDFTAAALNEIGLPFRAALNPAFSNALADPPIPVLLERTNPPAATPRSGASTRAGRKPKGGEVDWATRDQRNRLLGLQGEKLVLQYEIDRLKGAGRADLASRVRHVALTDCSAGYDIASFTVDGQPKRIEVKSTQGPATTPFYISINEVLVSREAAVSFSIYRVYGLENHSDRARFFELEGDVEETCGLQPVNFRATPNSGRDEG